MHGNLFSFENNFLFITAFDFRKFMRGLNLSHYLSVTRDPNDGK